MIPYITLCCSHIKKCTDIIHHVFPIQSEGFTCQHTRVCTSCKALTLRDKEGGSFLLLSNLILHLSAFRFLKLSLRDYKKCQAALNKKQTNKKHRNHGCAHVLVSYMFCIIWTVHLTLNTHSCFRTAWLQLIWERVQQITQWKPQHCSVRKSVKIIFPVIVGT